jgi:hypothetical protein
MSRSGKTDPSASVIWPGEPAPTAKIEFQKILFQAQVTKAAEDAKEKKPLTGRHDWVWWCIAGVFSIFVVLLARYPREKEDEPRPSRFLFVRR